MHLGPTEIALVVAVGVMLAWPLFRGVHPGEDEGTWRDWSPGQRLGAVIALMLGLGYGSCRAYFRGGSAEVAKTLAFVAVVSLVVYLIRRWFSGPR